MSNLESYKNNLKAAQELHEQAQREYDDFVVQLVKEGKMEEIVEAEWRERTVMKGDVGTLRIYCDHCMAYARTPIKSRRCPYCGAHMTNGTDVPKFATPSFVDDVSANYSPVPINDEQAQVNATPADVSDNAEQNISQELKRFRFAIEGIRSHMQCTQKVVAELLGMKPSQLCKYFHNDIKPRKATMEKICEVYKDIVGEPLPANPTMHDISAGGDAA